MREKWFKQKIIIFSWNRRICNQKENELHRKYEVYGK